MNVIEGKTKLPDLPNIKKHKELYYLLLCLKNTCYLSRSRLTMCLQSFYLTTLEFKINNIQEMLSLRIRRSVEQSSDNLSIFYTNLLLENYKENIELLRNLYYTKNYGSADEDSEIFILLQIAKEENWGIYVTIVIALCRYIEMDENFFNIFLSKINKYNVFYPAIMEKYIFEYNNYDKALSYFTYGCRYFVEYLKEYDWLIFKIIMNGKLELLKRLEDEKYLYMSVDCKKYERASKYYLYLNYVNLTPEMKEHLIKTIKETACEKFIIKNLYDNYGMTNINNIKKIHNFFKREQHASNGIIQYISESPSLIFTF